MLPIAVIVGCGYLCVGKAELWKERIRFIQDFPTCFNFLRYR